MDLILSAKKHTLRAVSVFSKTLSDLAEGELLQLQLAGSAETEWKDYFRIIYSKTASLFEAAAITAALSADAPEETVEAMGCFGREVGLAFQIRDDILDYAGTSEIGKPLGIDLKEGKITAPLLAAMDAEPSAEASVRKKMRRIGDEPALEEELRAFVLDHNGVELARAKVMEKVENAIKALSVLPESVEKSYLALLARHVGERKV